MQNETTPEETAPEETSLDEPSVPNALAMLADMDWDHITPALRLAAVASELDPNVVATLTDVLEIENVAATAHKLFTEL